VRALGTKPPLGTGCGGNVARGSAVHSSTQSQPSREAFRSLARGLTLATVCAVFGVCLATTTHAASSVAPLTLSLAWDASTSTNVTNYKLYYGTASRSYSQSVSVGAVTQTTLSGLTQGTTYFLAVTASDATGLESAYSNEISFTVPTSLPSVPELSLTRTGTKSVLRWATNYAGFKLQWSSSPAGTWANLTGNPVISGTYYVSTNTTSTTQRYYRLKK
jgi:fibronectin type 3 domain-containing protein